MKFNKTIMSAQECFISDCGNYKTIKYGAYWAAYFKPAIQKPFGNSVKKSNGKSQKYKTRLLALKDCLGHFEKYSGHHGAFDRL